MEKIRWDSSYSVGVDALDEQHKKIFDMINTLVDDPKAEYTSEKISDLIMTATTYAIEHFKCEEEYMESINYPGLAVHRLEHKNFMVKIAGSAMLVMQKKEGPTDLLAYLKTWLTHHIQFSDRKYMIYLEKLEKNRLVKPD